MRYAAVQHNLRAASGRAACSGDGWRRGFVSAYALQRMQVCADSHIVPSRALLCLGLFSRLTIQETAMVASASIVVSHRVEEGWHIFQSDQLPGLYVVNRDPRRAYEAVGPAIAQLVRLDNNIEVTAVPEVSFEDFIGPARAELTVAAARQRFNLFKAAA